MAALEVNGSAAEMEGVVATPDEVTLTTAGVARRYLVDWVGRTAFVDGPDGASTLGRARAVPDRGGSGGRGVGAAPRCRVEWCGWPCPWARPVEAGQILVVLEAMKMEHAVHAGAAGTVTEVDVAEGDQVETGQILVVVEPDDGDQGAQGEPTPAEGAAP